jgi:hypothetical protein
MAGKKPSAIRGRLKNQLDSTTRRVTLKSDEGYLNQRAGAQTNPIPSRKVKGECEMKMMLPKTISGWCMWLFFLWAGIGAFVALPMAGVVSGVLALGYAVFAFIGM